MVRKKRTPEAIFQIKVTLLNIKPPIWRRLLVPDNLDLGRLHHILQGAMGWMSAHLHSYTITEPARWMPVEEIEEDAVIEESTVLLRDALAKGNKLTYQYDFGDSWDHLIQLEKTLPFDAAVKMPVCIKGKRACPPEDVGGVWGYINILEALADPAHPEHEEISEWMDDGFDAEVFDIDEANKRLDRLT